MFSEADHVCVLLKGRCPFLNYLPLTGVITSRYVFKIPITVEKIPSDTCFIPMEGSFNQQLSAVFAWKMGSNPEPECVKP